MFSSKIGLLKVKVFFIVSFDSFLREVTYVFIILRIKNKYKHIGDELIIRRNSEVTKVIIRSTKVMLAMYNVCHIIWYTYKMQKRGDDVIYDKSSTNEGIHWLKKWFTENKLTSERRPWRRHKLHNIPRHFRVTWIMETYLPIRKDRVRFSDT